MMGSFNPAHLNLLLISFMAFFYFIYVSVRLFFRRKVSLLRVTIMNKYMKVLYSLIINVFRMQLKARHSGFFIHTVMQVVGASESCGLRYGHFRQSMCVW
jgi:hypothetical protein